MHLIPHEYGCLPPGPRCRRSNGSNEGGNTRAKSKGEKKTRERERADDSKERGDSESRMKNAITILKNGPGLPRERTSTFGPVSA